MRNQYPVSSYKSVGRFANGLAEEKVPDDIGKVSELRIRFMGHKGDNWIILSDVSVRTGLVHIVHGQGGHRGGEGGWGGVEGTPQKYARVRLGGYCTKLQTQGSFDGFSRLTT